MVSYKISYEDVLDLLNLPQGTTVDTLDDLFSYAKCEIEEHDLDDDLINTLLDFDVEKYELKKNILKKEIQNFFSGSKRAFFILTRLNLLNDLEINTKIGSKTLLETIDYEQVSINRITSFINKEWGEDFSNLIENAKKVFIGDKIQSMW